MISKIKNNIKPTKRKAHQIVKVNPDNNTKGNKVVVIGDSMVKYSKPNDLASH